MSGALVGTADTAAGPEHAFAYNRSTGVALDLGTLGGSTSEALGVNENGDICGTSELPNNTRHAFLRRADSGIIEDLGTLGGPTSWAFAVSTSGLVIGRSDTSDGTSHPFVAVRKSDAWQLHDLFLDQRGLYTSVSAAASWGADLIVGYGFPEGGGPPHCLSWRKLEEGVH